MPSSAGRSRRCRLLAFIAARSAAPLASAPISAIAGSIIATLAATPIIAAIIQSLERPSRPLTEPVGAAAGAVGAGIVLSTPPRLSVGAAAGEVGAGIAPGVLSTAVRLL